MEKRLSTGRLNVGPKPARKTPEGQEGPKGLPPARTPRTNTKPSLFVLVVLAVLWVLVVYRRRSQGGAGLLPRLVVDRRVGGVLLHRLDAVLHGGGGGVALALADHLAVG